MEVVQPGARCFMIPQSPRHPYGSTVKAFRNMGQREVVGCVAEDEISGFTGPSRVVHRDEPVPSLGEDEWELVVNTEIARQVFPHYHLVHERGDLVGVSIVVPEQPVPKLSYLGFFEVRLGALHWPKGRSASCGKRDAKGATPMLGRSRVSPTPVGVVRGVFHRRESLPSARRGDEVNIFIPFAILFPAAVRGTYAGDGLSRDSTRLIRNSMVSDHLQMPPPFYFFHGEIDRSRIDLLNVSNSLGQRDNIVGIIYANHGEELGPYFAIVVWDDREALPTPHLSSAVQCHSRPVMPMVISIKEDDGTRWPQRDLNRDTIELHFRLRPMKGSSRSYLPSCPVAGADRSVGVPPPGVIRRSPLSPHGREASAAES